MTKTITAARQLSSIPAGIAFTCVAHAHAMVLYDNVLTVVICLPAGPQLGRI